MFSTILSNTGDSESNSLSASFSISSSIVSKSSVSIWYEINPSANALSNPSIFVTKDLLIPVSSKLFAAVIKAGSSLCSIKGTRGSTFNSFAFAFKIRLIASSTMSPVFSGKNSAIRKLFDSESI